MLARLGSSANVAPAMPWTLLSGHESGTLAEWPKIILVELVKLPLHASPAGEA